jgi:hypothetical protein
VRAQVAALIKPWTDDHKWAVKPNTVKGITTLAKPTVFIEHTSIEQLDAAPIGNVSNTVVVTFLDSHTDYAQAEDALDGDVLDFITQLDASDRLDWTKAEKVTVIDTYLGWAVTVNLITAKE